MMKNLKFNRKAKFVIFAITTVLFISCKQKQTDIIDISGVWSVRLDSLNEGETKNLQNIDFDEKIQLPGTTDDAGMGHPNTLEPELSKPQLLRLTRKNSYVGSAWYTREIQIPEEYASKMFYLELERVIWQTDIWIDGNKIPTTQNSLSAPHRYNLSGHIIPGKKQRITIRVDNTKKMDISIQNLAHAYTNDTQIIWNGILGKLQIQAEDPIRIADIQVFPNVRDKSVKAILKIENHTQNAANKDLTITIKQKSKNGKHTSVKKKIHIEKGESTHEFDIKMKSDVELWSEFNPVVYQMNATLGEKKISSSKNVDFGIREFSAQGITLYNNDKPVFLRGTLECNIFPLTGYPPMTKPGWKKVFKTAKSWGLNHLRFHSWCPPKAAFEVADELGFYLQIELPAWTLSIGEDQSTTDYLYSEADRIIKEYGNHPSFCMWSMGNELQGDMSVLEKMVQHLKSKDNRHLYATTSFTFEKGHGDWPEPEDDFFITQWTKKGWVRGQGVFNSDQPTFDKDYRESIDGMEVPLITHEIGQYAVYPNLKEIDKYTGVLLPLNFMAIGEDLQNKGLYNKADSFTLASGKLASILYKEEIERALKTPGISGFQLLDLHDFPGQGTALVGLIDAFWDNKGIVSADEFRQHCNDVVPLLRFEKAVYTNSEVFEGSIDISNYSYKPLRNQKVRWKIYDGKTLLQSGEVKKDIDKVYNENIATVQMPLNSITKASKLTVWVELDKSEYKNHWDIWVYPTQQEVDFGMVKYTRSVENLLEMLNDGDIVLFNPEWEHINGIEGKFVPVFWSPVHFPKQAATMGILCDPLHKALSDFPTEFHSNWQWWDININSTTMITDSINGGASIISVIDNFVHNRKLSLVYEGKIGKGKIIIVSSDLKSDLANRPVASQLLISLLKYMNSDDFMPAEIKNPEAVLSLINVNQLVKRSHSTSIY